MDVHDGWIIDSGASFHCTSDLGSLQDVQELEGPEIRMANGVRRSSRRGTIRNERFQIPGVHYFQESWSRNIISVRQLEVHGLFTEFSVKEGCFVREVATGNVVGQGKLRNYLFVLDYLRVDDLQQQSDANDATTAAEEQRTDDNIAGSTG